MISRDHSLSQEEIRRRLDDILPRVERPSRYFAGEMGLVRKDWESSVARVLIAFPEVYEVAGANLGHLLIQRIVNDRPGCLAERVYAYWPDMEEKMRSSETPLYSLESLRSASDFDILGFSITHELVYSNVLMMIDLAGLELNASGRGFPIVVAGGSGVFNPEPMAQFVDVFVLGDGEEVVGQMLDEIASRRAEIDRSRGSLEKEKAVKAGIQKAWAEKIQGVYVPSHFEVDQDPDGRIREIKNVAGGPAVVKKALVCDLDSQPWVLNPPIPHMQGVAGRVTVEPARGCTRGCRFCQAGSIYRPYRMRSLDVLLGQAEKLLESTGLQELSFLALSVTDWPYLKDFIRQMQTPERDFHLRVSLPSGRIAALTRELTDLTIGTRKGGLTLAVEAGSQRLRSVINKDITDQDIEDAVTNALLSGWDLMKLYFMVGLPTETDEDVDEIRLLVERIMGLARSLKKSGQGEIPRLKLKVSMSNFVPKPHTAFQWAAMDSAEDLDRKQRMLLPLRKMKNVEYNSHDVQASSLEGVLARGDRRLGSVILRAFKAGARFDSWGDKGDPDKWWQAFKDEGLDPEWYLRERDLDAILPWDHLSCGVDKDWLKREWKRSGEGKLTPDCNETACISCGITGIYPSCKPLFKDEK